MDLAGKLRSRKRVAVVAGSRERFGGLRPKMSGRTKRKKKKWGVEEVLVRYF